jgi:hypothetical protein
MDRAKESGCVPRPRHRLVREWCVHDPKILFPELSAGPARQQYLAIFHV